MFASQSPHSNQSPRRGTVFIGDLVVDIVNMGMAKSNHGHSHGVPMRYGRPALVRQRPHHTCARKPRHQGTAPPAIRPFPARRFGSLKIDLQREPFPISASMAFLFEGRPFSVGGCPSDASRPSLRGDPGPQRGPLMLNCRHPPARNPSALALNPKGPKEYALNPKSSRLLLRALRPIRRLHTEGMAEFAPRTRNSFAIRGRLKLSRLLFAFASGPRA